MKRLEAAILCRPRCPGRLSVVFYEWPEGLMVSSQLQGFGFCRLPGCPDHSLILVGHPGQVPFCLLQSIGHALPRGIVALLREVFPLMLAPLPWMPVMGRAGAILLGGHIKAIFLIAQNEH